MIFEVLGWVAFALNVWSNLALNNQSRRGFIVRLASNACWIVYAPFTGAWALLVNHLTFAVINAERRQAWRRKQRRLRCAKEGHTWGASTGTCNTCSAPHPDTQKPRVTLVTDNYRVVMIPKLWQVIIEVRGHGLLGEDRWDRVNVFDVASASVADLALYELLTKGCPPA